MTDPTVAFWQNEIAHAAAQISNAKRYKDLCQQNYEMAVEHQAAEEQMKQKQEEKAKAARYLWVLPALSVPIAIAGMLGSAALCGHAASVAREATGASFGFWSAVQAISFLMIFTFPLGALGCFLCALDKARRIQ